MPIINISKKLREELNTEVKRLKKEKPLLKITQGIVLEVALKKWKKTGGELNDFY